MTKIQRRAIAEQLKANCALRGTPISIKHYDCFGGYIRVLPGKSAQFFAEDCSYPVFRSVSLQILREEAIALGLTHVRGLKIDASQYVAAIQEELHFAN